jgi:polar amino acid transport system substrate-binding protein
MSKRTKILLLDILLVALIIAAILVAGQLYYVLVGERLLRPTTPVVDDSWRRVQEAEKLVVGTSADYPPFAYYTNGFLLTGLDVALIREISQRLGVAVEIKDMAFEGLPGALQLHQIDVAIAALSVTTERQATLDFSNVYFVSEDAFLARQGEPDTVGAVTDIVTRRVGVQGGTVFEQWLQTELINTGQMPSGNLLVYERAEDAISDLRESRIDLVVMDLQPAELAAAQGGVTIVERGLNRQLFAIALPKGASALQAQINNVLTQMQNEGRLAELVSQYTGIDPGDVVTPPTSVPTPIPSPTSVAPTSTPVGPPTAVPCVDGMRHVADLNLDDQNMTAPPAVSPGQAFQKGWRISNSGTCTWNTGYRLVFVDGNQPEAGMGGQPTPIQALVAPGQAYDIFVNLIAPLQPGVYQGIWQMVNDRGQPFGDRIWVGITVPVPPTATPPPTQTPSPNISFTVDRTTILQGECATLSWNAQNVRETYLYAEGEQWQVNPVPPQGTRSVCPQRTTIYNLRVVKFDNTVEVRQVMIFVNPVPNAPVIAQFIANPQQVTAGQCLIIQWDVQGETTRITITANEIFTLWDGAPQRGSVQDCPASTNLVTYNLRAEGPGGTNQAQQYVTVFDPATATPAPTQPPAAPIINSFSVSPAQVQVGQCVLINWSASGGTSFVRLIRNGAVVLDNADFSGSAQDCLNYAGSVVYRLEASNSAGNQAAEERTVSVVEAPPVDPLKGTSWTLSMINGQPAIAEAVSLLSFGTNNDLNGSGGCNTFSGRYTANGGSITISDLQTSLILCLEPPGLQAQEEAFFNALRQAATYELPDSNTLIIRNGAGEEMLRFTVR